MPCIAANSDGVLHTDGVQQGSTGYVARRPSGTGSTALQNQTQECTRVREQPHHRACLIAS